MNLARAAAVLAGAAGASVAAGQVIGSTPPRIIQSPEPVDQGAPMAVCFQAGTDPRYVEAVTTLVNLRNQAFYGQDYFLGARWPGAQGSHKALTWSFVPDGLVISGGSEPANPSELFAQMDAGFAGQGGRTTWILRFQQVFDRWASLTGNTYTRVRYNNNDWDDGAAWGSVSATNLRGDVRIAMHNIDGSSNILAYNWYPSSGDMVLDSADINFFKVTTNSNRNLRNVLAHEHGHGLGLNHMCSSDSDVLMDPLENGNFDGPRQDDIRAVQRHYGDPFEPNDTYQTASPLGTLLAGAPLGVGALPLPVTGTNDANAALASIDADLEVDWYSFTIGAAMPITAVVTPVGSTYSDNAQGMSGCGSGNFTTAKSIADLVLQVYGSNGTTVLATASATGLGQAETISGLSLPAAGTYYLKVSAANHPAETQLYTLSLTSNCVNVPFISIQPQSRTAENGTNVVFMSGATNATSYRWRKDGADLVNGGRISGADTTVLTIAAVHMADAGVYTMRATGGCGASTSAGATLTVNCYANCDGSTVAPILNVSDFLCFYNKYLMSDPYANCDGSTVIPTLNIYDFICFEQKYTAGCP